MTAYVCENCGVAFHRIGRQHRRFCSNDCSNDHKRQYRGVPLTQGRLREVVSYDPGTGVFIRLISQGLAKAGDVSGYLGPDGYRTIGVDGRNYEAGRVAWFYVNGEWPVGEIDHKNTERDDNRIDNLREATNSQQKANSRLYKNNLSGFKGVSRHGSGWRARVRKDNCVHNLGIFPTQELAHAAYAEKAVELFGEFARVS